ncbi:hypothetical protein BC829DRAFT_390436 [Chytridium lagenaria]|nr:hypothetical protein BC829DRAFT_390436 [Chytridium lagenaria]
MQTNFKVSAISLFFNLFQLSFSFSYLSHHVQRSLFFTFPFSRWYLSPVFIIIAVVFLFHFILFY